MVCAPPLTIISTAIPKNLTLAQSAMLAGIVQAPSRLAPTHNLEARAEAQPSWCLEQWPTPASISAQRARSDDPRAAGRSAVASSRPGPISPTGSRLPRSQAFDADFGEVRVETTLDCDLQRLAVRAVNRAAIGDAQAALVAMRPDGEVVAMVGGKSYARIAVQPRDPGAAPARARRSSCSSISPRFAPAGRPTASSRTSRSPSTAGPRSTATASIAARSRCARRSRVRATRRRCGCPRRSGAAM